MNYSLDTDGTTEDPDFLYTTLAAEEVRPNKSRILLWVVDHVGLIEQY